MTFDPTKPVQTRNGKKARIICTDVAGGNGYPIIALITESGGVERSIPYSENGCYWADKKGDHSLDLVNVPEEISRWINVYTLGLIGGAHPSREEADEANERVIKNTDHKRTAIIQITLADDRVKKFVVHDM